jgi:hypothetical protein
LTDTGHHRAGETYTMPDGQFHATWHEGADGAATVIVGTERSRHRNLFLSSRRPGATGERRACTEEEMIGTARTVLAVLLK